MMLIRRFSIFCIVVFCLAVVVAFTLFHAKTPAFAKPLLDPIITNTAK